ncbi:adenylyl-sulfate kinase [Aeropyrum pernix K1]|uniref:Probable adenylyl-sulfate kinase n=1 Tax=Aeropyrum pernix (strain ATCC 700893 / DSM 11879 / JCM 9820 / NBRC 100138 / K1) TaxID=272557 RepID=CYSC_AERPE|nr:adenylyl-sulfate kinase [Aeropyrum pernix]Q9YCR6.2 RecName: Full=Probable adenylyl-sulfate kinase; AltName: Full=APS kinase; AltName: Full=ATP adenosine-5'-phosphosulfate 3'-phosphotransferase; AltName: Full=Adenosine-5'-phosphosulfate kinase [Aeropyrum pernix K1]BAA80181.2 adenylyl-sulfate kinase [Aeropyrum pernix K1]
MTTYKCIEKGIVVWLTGLPGSGKTTIATRLADLLQKEGYRVEVLDGDWARTTVSEGAGFTREERLRHLKRIAWIARLLARNGVIVICSFVSPYKQARNMVRRIVEEEGIPFLEIYVKASLEEVIRRDPKGLYKKALKGELENFTGITDPYEPPENPQLVLDTESNTIEHNVSYLYSLVKAVIE